MSLSKALDLLNQATFAINRAQAPEVERAAALAQVQEQEKIVVSTIRQRLKLAKLDLAGLPYENDSDYTYDLKVDMDICAERLERFEFDADAPSLRAAARHINIVEFRTHRLVKRLTAELIAA